MIIFVVVTTFMMILIYILQYVLMICYEERRFTIYTCDKFPNGFTIFMYV